MSVEQLLDEGGAQAREQWPELRDIECATFFINKATNYYEEYVGQMLAPDTATQPFIHLQDLIDCLKGKSDAAYPNSAYLIYDEIIEILYELKQGAPRV